MPLLSTELYREGLFSALRKASANIYLASAYITLPGIEAVLTQLSPQLKTLSVVVRWDARDLVSGASDLGVYEVLRDRGFQLFINQALHAKFVLLDDTALFLGSANCTGAGLQLRVKGNWEAGTSVIASELDRAAVLDLFAASVPISDGFYAELKDFIDSQVPSAGLDCAYPPSIAEKLQAGGEDLWVRELPWTAGPDVLLAGDHNADHDLRLFGISAEHLKDMTRFSHGFSQSRCCRWLFLELRQHGGQLYFGQLTKLLHDALLEDPKPYRKDVKVLVNNLANWSRIVLPDLISIDTPQHSQRIRLVERQEGSLSSSTGAFEEWISRLASLRRDEIPGRWSARTKNAAPHKPLLLLAILNNADREALPRLERLQLTKDLQERFYLLWRTLMGTSRRTNIALPFYHLSSDDLWEIRAGDGSDISTGDARSLRHLEDVGAFAHVHSELSELLGDQKFRRIATDTILTTYFEEGSAELLKSAIQRG